MIDAVKIINYKSIEKLKLELGRVTVLIGGNGSGKSNILEAIALGSAALSNRLDNEFLASRGIRVTEPNLMRSAFEKDQSVKKIKFAFIHQDSETSYELDNDNRPFSKWKYESNVQFSYEEMISFLKNNKSFFEEAEGVLPEKYLRNFLSSKTSLVVAANFLIYAPENNKIRNFKEETQIEPLGIYGEGLFKLLTSLEEDLIDEIKEHLQFIDWFDDFQFSEHANLGEKRLFIKDRHINDTVEYFDQRSANEGFLFLLFYLTLIVSPYTPKFFAVDNIDNSLNPKLCSSLVKVIVKLARKYDKQVILTTHNPAVLDGLNLNDVEQRLYVVSRNGIGRTKIRTVMKPALTNGEEPIRLSEAFLRGYFGGLNKI